MSEPKYNVKMHCGKNRPSGSGMRNSGKMRQNNVKKICSQEKSSGYWSVRISEGPLKIACWNKSSRIQGVASAKYATLLSIYDHDLGI